MKKFIRIFLVGMLVLALAGCTAKEDKPGEEGKTYNIGLAIYQYNDNFMTAYRTELVNYFDELGKEDGNTYVVDMQDGKSDQANQTEQINNFVLQEVDLIIANLVDPTAAENMVNLAKGADIPIIFINREPEVEVLEIWPGKTAYIGADATQSGYFQGEMINNLPDKGDLNGDGTVSYITLLGDPGNVDAQQRTEYSIKALNDADNANKALLPPQQADWDTEKGRAKTADALAQFGKAIEVVFANNDGMALGAVAAIEDAGFVVNEDIYVVGVDAIPEALDLLKSGKLTGTVLNDHYNQSHTVADMAVKLLNGEDISSYYWHDYVMVLEIDDAELSRKDAKIETVEQVRVRYEERNAE